MFDIGWSEMMVVAVLTLLIMGPKELPNTLRNVSKWVRKAKGLAREFQSGVDEVIRESDLQDARKALEGADSESIRKTVEEVIDPSQSLTKASQDVKDGLDAIAKDDGKEENDPFASITRPPTNLVSEPVKKDKPEFVTPDLSEANSETNHASNSSADNSTSSKSS